MFSIEAKNLTKRFGSLTAVDHLNFRVRRGEIFGILGPNGAGKTTTIRMLACLISPSEGSARVGEYDISKEPLKVRKIVGILTENPCLYERLTAYENMDFFGEAYGISDRRERKMRIRELLEFFGLWERRNDKVATFSRGMKQKLAIARALIHHPPILFLDEPTSNLDPESSKEVRELIERLSRSENSTVLLCTHRLEDAEKLCSRVMIINKGKRIAAGTPDELRSKIVSSPVLQIKLRRMDNKVVEAIKELPQVKKVEVDNTTSQLFITLDDESTVPQVVKSAVYAGGLIMVVNLLFPSLEEVYLKLVKEGGR
ncbi:MAG TPA: ABC transporter ATP-binding protein [Candidatus Bathyarchaeota archaeon]|nr:ABC transporter ATP-binding protein [Candidatus Bathyarchaeota archaeon]